MIGVLFIKITTHLSLIKKNIYINRNHVYSILKKKEDILTNTKKNLEMVLEIPIKAHSKINCNKTISAKTPSMFKPDKTQTINVISSFRMCRIKIGENSV